MKNTQKKILVFANSPSGFFKFRKELIESLINNGYHVVLSLPHGKFVDKLEKIGCEFIETPIDRRGINPIKDFGLFLNYIRQIKSIRPDSVLLYTIKPNIYGGMACRFTNVKYISNITGLGTALENKGLFQKIIILLYKIALKNVECIFFQNSDNKKFFLEKIKKKVSYKLIPGSGVNLSHLQVLNYPNNKTIEFAFVARVMKAKGIEEYIEAAEYICLKYQNVKFHVCGGCEESYLDKLNVLHDKGVIIYHGEIDNIQQILINTHCLVNPSHHEGMSNVLLEAAATGRPVIASNVAGCRETFDEEISGYGFKVKNSKSLIDVIDKFICLPYHKKNEMGLAGRKKVEKEFNRNIVIKAYLNEIEKLYK